MVLPEQGVNGMEREGFLLVDLRKTYALSIAGLVLALINC